MKTKLNHKNAKLAHLFSMLVAFVMCVMAVGSVEDSDSSPPIEGKLGQPTQTGDYEIVVTGLNVVPIVGNQLLGQKLPSTGGAFITIDWSYKNITKKPLSSWSNPDVVLIDPNGAEYEPDAEATILYAANNNDDEKVFSNLNPGITVSGTGKIYEVSKDLCNNDGWKVKIKADKTVIFPAKIKSFQEQLGDALKIFNKN